jgi:cobalt-zinc-cadmium efflux system protein
MAHDHTHEHTCQHGHGGGHHHGDPNNHGRAFIIAIGLNSAYVVVEFIYGFIANSTALMADAGHNLSDVLGLAMAWGAAILVRRAPSDRFTYGLRSTSILAALANAMFLLIASGAIAWEAIQRFSAPPAVDGLTVTLVAGVGIFINGLSAWLFAKGSKGDLNIRAAYLHMAADAAVSLGVVARSGHQSVHRGGDRHRHMGSVARVVATGPECRSRAYRHLRGGELPAPNPRCH